MGEAGKVDPIANQPDPTGDIPKVYLEVSEILRPKTHDGIVDFAQAEMPSWDSDLAMLLHKPMSDLGERKYKSVIFVGAARTGKTYSLVTLYLAYTVMADPVDMAVFMPSESLASYYSKKRWGVELMSELPQIRGKMRGEGGSDTVYTKILKSGAIINFGWNSVTQLASKDFVRVVMSDIDRALSNREGDFFSLAAKRVTTAMSRGMVLAESSPGKQIEDPEYIQKSLHDAPPTTGILGLYNQGNQQIVYSQCHHCKEYFSPPPGPQAFYMDKELPRDERVESAYMICTNCGAGIGHEHEKEFKRTGVWVGAGQTIDSNGEVHGELRSGTTASYWQFGWFAAFVSWKQILIEVIDAQDDFERTNNEDRLRTVYNTTLAAPYLEHARRLDTGTVGRLQARAETLERFVVPHWGRVLLASIDVQNGVAGRFVVQVMCYGKHGERCVIDRYDIAVREDNKRVSPHTRIEDWDLITERVVNSTYTIEGTEDLEMRIYRTAIDVGGSAGTTERAYEYYRGLKQLGLASRVHLVKGGTATNANLPIAKQSYPDASDKADKFLGGRGDVPLLTLNTLLLKDAVMASVDREEPGANFFHFSTWLSDRWYRELLSEKREAKQWVQIAKRNETFDLCCYVHALWFYIKGHQVKWESGAKPWCASLEVGINTEVMSREARLDMKKRGKKKIKRKVRFKYNG